MSFFKQSTKKEDIQSNTGSNYLNASGCFPVNIVAPFVNTSDNGSTSVDMFIDYNGQEQTIYGNLRVTNNDGTPNKIGAKTFNQLLVIAEVEEVGEPTEAELPIGKKGAATNCAVLEELSSIDVILRIQMEYSTYLGNVQEKKVIRGFYRAGDMASAEEIVNGTEAGVQYAKEEKYFDNVTYKNDLDADAIAAWVAGGRKKGTAGKSSGGTPAKRPSFGKAKTFGKS